MTQNQKFLSLIDLAFPLEPKPDAFFSEEGKNSCGYDIPRELEKRLFDRYWTEITLMDWRMIGAAPVVARRYFEPAAFMYYLPSLIVGVSQEIEFVDFALEGMIPDNKYHVPRGKWWFEFSNIASSYQQEALVTFLSYIRLVFWDRIGSANQYLLERAESIWTLRQ
jgi:hypothetical protein